MSRDPDSKPQDRKSAPHTDEYTPTPDELEEPSPTAGPEPSGERGPEDVERGYEDARFTHEQAYMTRGVVILFVLVVGFMFGVWSLSWELLEKQAAKEEMAHSVTTAVSGLHRAMYGQGIILHEDTPSGMAAWLKQKLGDHARLPDLSAAGLVPVGVRTLKTGTGFGYVRYQGPGGDLILVMAPKDMILVPEDAELEKIAGSEVWLQETSVLRLVYVSGAHADWVLVAAPGQADLPAVTEVLLEHVAS